MISEQPADSGEMPDDKPKREFQRTAGPWLAAISDAEKAFADYNARSDSIDKLYANLAHLAGSREDRELQIFWANLEVMRPSIYARPPIPVVVPSFKDRDEMARQASEVLERTLITSFRQEDIDCTMRAVRDDMARNSRGVMWLRYEAEQEDDGSVEEEVCYEHVERKDFLHEPARKWKEVGWVAKRAYMTQEDGVERFGEAFLQCKFNQQKVENQDWAGKKKAEVWELWSKTEELVVWVSPGVDEVLDIQEPFLDLENFYPCPRPAYGTLQPGSLIPIPDFLYYKDQIEEINELTARISGLCESLKIRGFYAQGGEDVSSAIERAMKSQDNAALLIAVPAHLMAGQGMKDAILWLPVEVVATTIKELIENRTQLIQDVYQVTGLSDIMRGDTKASETLGAQKLKSQYGSIRIREKQNEIIRIARDATRIAAEIMAENFSVSTFAEMSRVRIPETQPEPPEGVDPSTLPPPPLSMDQIVAMFREERVRGVVLDIETDSTIQPDEEGEKAARIEFITAVGGYFQQALPLVQAVPEAAPLAVEMLKFAASAFRAGRPLEGAIEDFGQQVEARSKQPKPPSPEQMKIEADMQIAQAKAQADGAKSQADIQVKQMEGQLKAMDLQMKQVELRIKEIEADTRMHESGVKKMQIEREAMQPEEQVDPLDQETKAVGIEKTRAEIEATRASIEQQKYEREQSGRKVSAEASDAENKARQSESAAKQSEAQGELIANMMKQLAELTTATQAMAKSINAPRRLVRDPATGKAAGVETVM